LLSIKQLSDKDSKYSTSTGTVQCLATKFLNITTGAGAKFHTNIADFSFFLNNVNVAVICFSRQMIFKFISGKLK